MTSATSEAWLAKLGYRDEPAVLHLSDEHIRGNHPYALGDSIASASRGPD